MTTPPDPERSDPHGIDLSKQRPGTGQPPPAPGGAWSGGHSSAAPPPPPGYAQQPGGHYPPQWSWPGQPAAQGQFHPPGPYAPGGARISPADERTWAGAAHWSALIASLVFLAFLGPLLVLLVKGGDSPFVRRQAVESLNFQLTILIAAAVSFALAFVVVGLLLLPLVGLAWLVFTVLGAVKASSGEDYRYPVSLRMVR